MPSESIIQPYFMIPLSEEFIQPLLAVLVAAFYLKTPRFVCGKVF